jgi:phosphoglycerol transferase MdoB-like AlkP superfamily enzyme
MKTKKYLLSLILVSLLAVSLLASPAKGLAATSTLEDLDVELILTKIVNWLITILLVVAALFIVLAAFTFVTAGGDPEKINTARNQVLYALIGVGVALLAWGLVALVKKIIGV